MNGKRAKQLRRIARSASGVAHHATRHELHEANQATERRKKPRLFENPYVCEVAPTSARGLNIQLKREYHRLTRKDEALQPSHRGRISVKADDDEAPVDTDVPVIINSPRAS